jgi:hypothetical protein
VCTFLTSAGLAGEEKLGTRLFCAAVETSKKKKKKKKITVPYRTTGLMVKLRGVRAVALEDRESPDQFLPPWPDSVHAPLPSFSLFPLRYPSGGGHVVARTRELVSSRITLASLGGIKEARVHRAAPHQSRNRIISCFVSPENRNSRAHAP